MTNKGSKLILPNLVAVNQKNIHTKFETNPCSGLREEVEKVNKLTTKTTTTTTKRDTE